MLDAYSRLTNSLVDLVNSQRGLNRKTRNALLPRELRNAFMDGAKLAVELGLVVDTLSEMSVRLQGAKIMATAAGAYFTRLKEDQIGVFSQTGQKSLDKKSPPRHIEWHQTIYADEQVNAVFYCQSPSILWAANSEILPDAGIIRDVEDLIREATFVAPDVESIQKSLGQASMLMIPHHGLLTWGEDIYQAITKAEIMDQCCAVTLISRGKG